MPYRIEFSREVRRYLAALTARQRAIVLAAIQQHLRDAPTNETRNRKPLRPNHLAPWELRVGDLRV